MQYRDVGGEGGGVAIEDTVSVLVWTTGGTGWS